MNSLRIGCDRIIRWSITSGGEPYDLSGKNIRLKVSTRSTQFYVSTDDFSIDGNKIIWLFRGKDQKHLGPYTLTYIENEGMDDMLTFDRCNAFNFVACSCQESRSSSEDMEISNIDLSSEIKALGVKIEDLPIIKGEGAGNSAILKGETVVSGTTYKNRAISQTSMAVGAATTAGLKGWYYSAIDFTNKTITLSDKPTDILTGSTLIGGGWSSGAPDIEVDDVISLVNNSKYDLCSKVTAVNGNVITVDSLPFTELVRDEGAAVAVIAGYFSDGYSLYIPERPDAGIIDFGGGAFSEGGQSKASNICAHAEGLQTHAYGQYSHAEGRGTKAGYAAHAEGRENIASGNHSHAEGESTVASGANSHAEGYKSTASGYAAHAEGSGTTASNKRAHAEGTDTKAHGESSHAEGYASTASGYASHSEGNQTNSDGIYSHAEGDGTRALTRASHTEGHNTKAGKTNDNDRRPTNVNITDEGVIAHAEGISTWARNTASHAEGKYTVAYDKCSHSEGQNTFARGIASHAEGYGTITNNTAEHASGRHNRSTKSVDASEATRFSIGIGTGDSSRRNAVEVKENGDVYIIGVGGYNGTNSDSAQTLQEFLANL